ncbi:MAG TPA: putative zinc-binding peptidase [Burkholderiaceae bacterium]|nr:putative zinc-binding peptidase [Burkholderiaceae bacterium]
MKLFTCARCGQLLFFENVACTRCGATLGFLPEPMRLAALEPAGDATDEGIWQPIGEPAGAAPRYRRCANYAEHAVCNWMVQADDDEPLCLACRLNRTIPDLSVAPNEELWRTLEREKHRLVYSLLRFGLPVIPRSEDPSGLEFDFLADTASRFSERGRVLTGHSEGLITINIAEADPAERERMRTQMAEPYRTILGHFRHESGHYYWDRLIRESAWLDECRRLFGDDTLDYSRALEHHYSSGPPADWSERFVSAYASMHPWEDWAETWAHYLHIVDTLETAYEFGLRIRPRAGDDDALAVRHDFNAYHQEAFEPLIEHWLPLTFALNSLNRSMGHEHAYPFVLAPAVIEKLGFVHGVVHAARGGVRPKRADSKKGQSPARGS